MFGGGGEVASYTTAKSVEFYTYYCETAKKCAVFT
jgi:hypothetical protein